MALVLGHSLWLSRTRRWAREQIEAYQRRALRSILRHAVATVPYYRELGIRANDIDGPESLGAFPMLTKAIVQEHGDRLLSESYDRSRLHVSHSSGSTGQPASTLFDPSAWALMKHALKLRRTLTDLRRPPYRVLVIGEEAERDRVASRHSIAAVSRLSIHGSAAAHFDVVERFRPAGIYGTPSWLLELAQAAQRRGVSLPRPRVVWTSSEVLTPAARAEIESVFDCPVRDIYGGAELKEVAAECPYGRRHVNFESSYVEVLEDTSGEPGPLAITSLANRAMPLIRYRVGDIGRLVAGVCECGRAAPWLDGLDGREVDLIPLPDGRKISPYVLSTTIEGHTGIARYQLLQQSAQHIELRYELRPGAEPLDATSLETELGRAVGGGLRFSSRRVDAIEKTPAGKHVPLIRAARASARAGE